MIRDYSFGKIVIDNKTYTSDIKIVSGKVVPNWWRKSGHRVEIEDINDLLESKADILLLGKGKPGLMGSTESLKKFLKKNSIELIEQNTSSAVKTYNRLMQEGRNVYAGFHLTC